MEFTRQNTGESRAVCKESFRGLQGSVSLHMSSDQDMCERKHEEEGNRGKNPQSLQRVGNISVPTSQSGKPCNSGGIRQRTQKGLASVVGEIGPHLKTARRPSCFRVSVLPSRAMLNNTEIQKYPTTKKIKFTASGIKEKITRHAKNQ